LDEHYEKAVPQDITEHKSHKESKVKSHQEQHCYESNGNVKRVNNRLENFGQPSLFRALLLTNPFIIQLIEQKLNKLTQKSNGKGKEHGANIGECVIMWIHCPILEQDMWYNNGK